MLFLDKLYKSFKTISSGFHHYFLLFTTYKLSLPDVVGLHIVHALDTGCKVLFEDADDETFELSSIIRICYSNNFHGFFSSIRYEWHEL